MEKELNSSLNSIKEVSGELTAREFVDEVTALLREKYPSTGGYYSTKSFDSVCCSPTEVTVEQSQDVDKYANPEKYSFLYREYDNSIHIDHNAKSYKEFCKRNAPAIIPELAKYCEADVDATLGDKEWLSVGRRYTFPVKFGYSRKSIEAIKEIVFGVRTKLLSIEEQIANAQKQSSGARSSSSIDRNNNSFESR